MSGEQETPVARHGRLQVCGKEIHGETSKRAVSLAGVSFFSCQRDVGSIFYTKETVAWLIEDW